MADDLKALQDKVRFLQTRLRVTYQRLEGIMDANAMNRGIIDRLYDEFQTLPPRMNMARRALPFDGITFIVAAYQIPKQIQRTVQSLSPGYQRVPPNQIEVIIVDNGSTPALTMADFKSSPWVKKVMRVDGKPSPVHGLNAAVAEAKFSNVALLIDGAHMLSPGVFNHAKSAFQTFENAVVNVPQYLLGRASQNLVPEGDAFEKESEDLEKLNWPNDGYALFSYCVFAGEDRYKDIYLAGESNCLITSKAVLEKFGAFDERFDEPGAGFANLELFTRLMNAPENKPIILPGEGTFHQDHNGTTTKPNPSERQEEVAKLREKLEAVTGSPDVVNARPQFAYGTVPKRATVVPTISHEYYKAKNQILNELSEIYIMRELNGETGPRPHLVARKPTHEHLVRPTLKPLGLRDVIAKTRGVEPEDLNYLRMLARMHTAIDPNLYFEIGVNTGESLALSKCFSIGVDPASELIVSFHAPTRMFRETSDAFFDKTERCENLFQAGIDFAFLDGMHLSEFIVRDVLNTEPYMKPNGVIVIDDIFPEQDGMAGRPRPFNAWCGDVYKIIPVLQRYRPDLKLHVFEGFIGPYRKGLAMITGLNPGSTVLADNYEHIEAELEAGEYDVASVDDLDAFVPVADVNDIEDLIAQARG